jgi:hypothetical protein
VQPVLLLAARGLLVAGPVVLAFASGGYFDGPRLVALGVAAVALALVAGGADRPVPASAAGRAAIGGLLALAGWVWLGTTWAPAGDIAGDDAERVLLYAVALAAAAGAWHSRAAAWALEPAVALGVLVVVGFGLAGRLVPGIVELTETDAAGGRLAQPLTYWNAMGALAAVGAVLCVRVAGERARRERLRMLAAAGAVPLLLGVYLSFSRGALLALVAGLVVLLVLAPTWSQLRAVAITLEAGLVAVAAAELSPAVRALSGDRRELEGALVLLVVLLAMGAAAAATRWADRVEAQGRTRLGRLPLPGWAGIAALGVVLALVVVPVVLSGQGGGAGPRFGAEGSRFGSVDSNRYAYWEVAVRSWAAHPLQGVGTGGFEVEWLRERPFAEGARDAHSLPLETLAELGLVGALLLAAVLGGIALAARRVQADDPVLAAGPAAALTAWLVHASLDWDWEMPALTLVALGLAGMLVARSGGGAAGPPAASGLEARPLPHRRTGPAAAVSARRRAGGRHS